MSKITAGTLAWYAGLAVGVFLIFLPDPGLTQIPGLLIVGGLLGVEVLR